VKTVKTRSRAAAQYRRDGSRITRALLREKNTSRYRKGEAKVAIMGDGLDR
jgi:hypothetical protein